MATPTGYPDWQRLNNRVGAPLINQTVNATATYDSGTLFVGSYESLGLSFNPTGNSNYQVTVTWYEDQAATLQILQYTLFFGDQAGPAYFALPVDALWVKIHVGVGSNGGTDHYQIVLTPSVNENNPGYPASQLLINNGGTTIAAGGNDILYATPQMAGKAALNIWTDSASWSAQLFALFGALGYTQFWYEKNVSGGVTHVIIGLPCAPIQLRLNNFSASTQSFQASLTTLT